MTTTKSYAQRLAPWIIRNREVGLLQDLLNLTWLEANDFLATASEASLAVCLGKATEGWCLSKALTHYMLRSDSGHLCRDLGISIVDLHDMVGGVKSTSPLIWDQVQKHCDKFAELGHRESFPCWPGPPAPLPTSMWDMLLE